MDLDGMKYVFTRLFALFFDVIRISRISFQKYNNPVMICKIFVRLFSLFTVALHKNANVTYAVASRSFSDLSHTLPVLMR